VGRGSRHPHTRGEQCGAAQADDPMFHATSKD
jgi:hypothetical protein